MVHSFCITNEPYEGVDLSFSMAEMGYEVVEGCVKIYDRARVAIINATWGPPYYTFLYCIKISLVPYPGSIMICKDLKHSL